MIEFRACGRLQKLESDAVAALPFSNKLSVCLLRQNGGALCSTGEVKPAHATTLALIQLKQPNDTTVLWIATFRVRGL